MYSTLAAEEKASLKKFQAWMGFEPMIIIHRSNVLGWMTSVMYCDSDPRKIAKNAIGHVKNEQGAGYEHIFSSVQTFDID